MSELHKALSQVALAHRRVRAVNFGREYACLCGKVLRSNSHHVLAKHQADVILDTLANLPAKVVERVAQAIEDVEAYPNPRGYIEHAEDALAALVRGEEDD